MTTAVLQQSILGEFSIPERMQMVDGLNYDEDVSSSGGSYAHGFPKRTLCMSSLPSITDICDNCTHSSEVSRSTRSRFQLNVKGHLDHPEEAVRCLPGLRALHCRLGIGSFGHVYRCSVANSADEVAVKVLLSEPPETDQEASLLKQLNHPHLVRLLDYIQVENAHMLVLELCSGGSLSSFLHGSNRSSSTKFGLWMRLNAMIGIVSAIEYLHSVNIIHRDVKSSNCFLSYQIDPWAIEIPPLKLGDLGLARPAAMENMTRGAGTIRYMAPEVITSRFYGLAADVFSIGIMLHEFVTGTPPFGGGGARLNEGAIASNIVKGGRPLLESLSPAALNVDLPCLLESCWAQDPSVRPTASEVICHLSNSIQRVPPNAA